MVDLTPERALIFRITHIENVPWILENGLYCRNSGKFDGNFREIGNPELIGKRANRQVPEPPGGTLSDYIPFYFTPHSPMLYNIKTGWNGLKQTPMPDIAIVVSSLHSLIEHGVRFLFTDRHAYVMAAQFSSELERLDRIDWKLLSSRNFTKSTDDPGRSERYQAEALVYREMPVAAILGIACFGESQTQRIAREVERLSISLKLVTRPDWYF